MRVQHGRLSARLRAFLHCKTKSALGQRTNEKFNIPGWRGPSAWPRTSETEKNTSVSEDKDLSANPVTGLHYVTQDRMVPIRQKGRRCEGSTQPNAPQPVKKNQCHQNVSQKPVAKCGKPYSKEKSETTKKRDRRSMNGNRLNDVDKN